MAAARQKTTSRDYSKCLLCFSNTPYEICGECIKCPLCGGPSINGKREIHQPSAFNRKVTFRLSGECPKCNKEFERIWEIPFSFGREQDIVEVGAFVLYDNGSRAEPVEAILKKPPSPPSSVNLGRFRALLVDEGIDE